MGSELLQLLWWIGKHFFMSYVHWRIAVRTKRVLPPPLEIIVFTYPVMMRAKLKLWLIDLLFNWLIDLFRFNTSDYRPLRAVLFVCLGGFGLVPTVHLFIQNGWSGALVNFYIYTLHLTPSGRPCGRFLIVIVFSKSLFSAYFF